MVWGGVSQHHLTEPVIIASNLNAVRCREDILLPHPLIQQVPDVLNGIEIRTLRWPWQDTDIPVLQKITHRTSSMAGGIDMSG